MHMHPLQALSHVRTRAHIWQVRGSKSLKQTIEYALAVGNYLNGGTNKGGAWGFKIESLNKLIGTKTLDNKSTRARWRLLAC